VVLEQEATIVLIAARQLAHGQPLSPGDGGRLAAAVTRIESARRMLGGQCV
jgi:hypothetical protein